MLIERGLTQIAMAQRHGTIDVLVNNAGIASWEGQGPIEGPLDHSQCRTRPHSQHCGQYRWSSIANAALAKHVDVCR